MALVLMVLGWLKGLGQNIGVIVGAAFKNPYVIGAIAAGALAFWALHETRRADGLAARLKASDGALAEEHRAFASEQATTRGLIAARGRDHASAVHSATDADKACSARVAVARRSASAITHLLNEAPHANPDPREPELLSASRLRDALGR